MNPSSDTLNSTQETANYDVVVAGAGIGGVCAAVAAARLGAKTLLLEKQPEIGGTGVHSPVGLICTYVDKSGRVINDGLHRELFPHIYQEDPFNFCQTYDECELLANYHRLLAGEPNLTVQTNAEITSCRIENGRLKSVGLASSAGFEARVWIDATADGNLAALAGADWKMGNMENGALQPATLTFRVGPVDFPKFGLTEWRTWAALETIWAKLQPFYDTLQQSGTASNTRDGVLCFPDLKGETLLFNQTRIFGVDPTDPVSMCRARQQGETQVSEFWDAIRGHPALEGAEILHVSTKLGVREGRRILGDYVLTEADCLGEARFPDMVAACGYALDIHNPRDGTTRLEAIPGSGYYHIPYRCLISRDFPNLLLGSRCISGTHEAHSSYRVMSSISAIGQAAGTAAALCAQNGAENVRAIPATAIRAALRAQGQFAEA